MYRAEALRLVDDETQHSLAMELVEVSAIAGRIMVTGLARDLRLTAVVENAQSAPIGSSVHFELPEIPQCWFSTDGERIG